MLLIYLGILICILILNSIPYMFSLSSFISPRFEVFCWLSLAACRTRAPNQISSLELLLSQSCNITHPNSKPGVWAQVWLAGWVCVIRPPPILFLFRETFFAASFCYSAVPGFKPRDWPGPSLWWITVSPGHPAGDRFLPALDCFPTKLQ